MKLFRWMFVAAAGFSIMSVVARDAHAQRVDVHVDSALAGAATFAPAYLSAIIAGAMVSEHTANGSARWGFNGCPSVTIWPVVGPFMGAAVANDRKETIALLIDGAAQLTGVGVMTVGLVWPKYDLTNRLMPLPIFSRDMTGFALTGKF